MELLRLAGLFTPLDGLAVAVLLIAWVGIGRLIEHPHGRRRSVTVMMSQYRLDWMAQMAARENRIFDSQIMGNLRQGTAFFASTSIIAIGGVATVAGNTETLRAVVGGLLADPRPIEVFQVKLVVVALMLTVGFLRFVWANRVFGYCSVVMGAVPPPGDVRAPAIARQAGEMNVRAAWNFNRGLRSLYFALAALTWTLGAGALILAVAATVWTLWRREFASSPWRILRENEEGEGA